MSDMQPVKLALKEPGQLLIAWSDGQQRLYPIRQLRERCPCATCRERRLQPPPSPPTGLNILSPAELRPLTIKEMRPVGQYAYHIGFSDGHDTGIYTFELLRALGSEA